LRQVFNVLAAAGQSHQRAKDECLVLADHIFELRFPMQAVSDRSFLRKFHSVA
jgi:hypothetical protein